MRKPIKVPTMWQISSWKLGPFWFLYQYLITTEHVLLKFFMLWTNFTTAINDMLTSEAGMGWHNGNKYFHLPVSTSWWLDVKCNIDNVLTLPVQRWVEVGTNVKQPLFVYKLSCLERVKRLHKNKDPKHWLIKHRYKFQRASDDRDRNDSCELGYY